MQFIEDSVESEGGGCAFTGIKIRRFRNIHHDSRVIANLKGKNVICGDLNSLWKCNRSNKVGNVEMKMITQENAWSQQRYLL